MAFVGEPLASGASVTCEDCGSVPPRRKPVGYIGASSRTLSQDASEVQRLSQYFSPSSRPEKSCGR